jgi:hypothetical protein
MRRRETPPGRMIDPARMIAGKPPPEATQNCFRRPQDDIFWRSMRIVGSIVIILLFQRKCGPPRDRAAVRRTHGRHAAILLDFYCDQFIFSRSTRVPSIVLWLAVLTALTVEF